MMQQVRRWIVARWRLLMVLLTPLVLLPLPVIETSTQARCGYVVLILIIFWVFEVIPLPVTSLLPLVLFPMAGVLTAKEVAPEYFKEIISLFFGSLSLAYAIESVNLHRRVALFVLSVVGTSVKWSMAGLMAVTAFLSMWINNSAAASIMLPVALAISNEIGRHGIETEQNHITDKERSVKMNDAFDSSEPDVIPDSARTEEPYPVSVEVKARGCVPCRKRNVPASERAAARHVDLKKGFVLSVAYSATIGGLATLVGTAPNVLVKGFVESQYKNTNFKITFFDFLLFALPVAVIMLISCWVWLQIYFNRREFFRCRSDPQVAEAQSAVKAMLVQQYKALGKISWSEGSVAIVFLLTILLWLTKDFGGTPGWEIVFRNDYIGDGTVAVLCGLLPLILPNANPFRRDWKYQPIVQWDDLVKNIAWGAIFLLGAGLSIALAFDKSGLSETVGQALKFLTGVPRLVVMLLVIVISGLFTEVTSNLSTASIFFPVLDSVAFSSGIHPAFLILPCTLAVSLAFMLPIATPPNAIVFNSGAIKVIDMIKVGVVMNIIGFAVIFLAATTWMPKIYGIDDRATQLILGMNRTTN